MLSQKVNMRKIEKLTKQRVRNSNLSLTLLIPIVSFIFFSFSSLHSADPSSEEINQEQTSGQSYEEISDWQARLELARVLSYSKKYDESLREYQKLLQDKPDSMIVRIEMAKILVYQEKTEEALDQFLKIPPEHIDDKTWIMIADIYSKNKNYAEAEKIYSHYLQKFPEDDKARLKLAEILSWHKRYDESIHQYRMILRRHPEDIQVRRRYAQVLTWMGEDQEAIKEWKKTLK